MLSDEELDRVVDAIYAESIAASTADMLTRCPPRVPSPEQVTLLRGVVAWARRRGCRLPAFRVYWVDGRPDICHGAVSNTPPQSGQYSMWLNVNRSPPELAQTIAHELLHLHDFESGKAFSRIELERRADEFAASVPEDL